ncbi:MAG: tripartite tricarboxylate transporter substrate binding protein [Pseudomonadota bacterium]
MNRRTMLVAAAVALLGFAAPAMAQYPDKPVNVIVGFAAGGGTDSYGRGLSKVSEKHLGQPMIIVNKPGGSSIPAAAEVSQAPPDGYTLFLSSHGGLIINDLKKDLVVDPIDGFDYVGVVGGLTTGVYVPINSPYQNLDELVAAIEANPGALRWGHTGRGAGHHTAGVGFLVKNDLEAQDVPFKGGAPTRAALIGEQVDFSFMGAHLITGFEDQMRQLGVANDERLSSIPDIPTIPELGYDYVGVLSPITLLAPKGTDPAIITNLGEAVEQMVADPDYQAFMSQSSLPVFHLGPEEAKALAEKSKSDWAPIIELTGAS